MDYRLRLNEDDTISLTLDGKEVSSYHIEREFLRSKTAYLQSIQGDLWSGPHVIKLEESESCEEFPYLDKYCTTNGKTLYISKAGTDIIDDPLQPALALLQSNPIGRDIEQGVPIHWRDSRYIVLVGSVYILIDTKGNDSDTTTILLINSDVMSLDLCIFLESQLNKIRSLEELNRKHGAQMNSSFIPELNSNASASTYKRVQELNHEAMSKTIKSKIGGEYVE